MELETKYRDIADGNVKNGTKGTSAPIVGNQVPRYSGWKPRELQFCLKCRMLETKYRDIADGNFSR